MTIIATHHLTKRYGRRVGIESVDLRVDEGEIFGFLGPNGSGKTTTIRLLLGFLRPSAGSASIFNIDCWRRSHAIKREVGYLPGDLRLYPWMTARNALRIVGRVRGMDLAGPGAALAERFEMEMTVPVRKMSRGMRQKLGLILALAHEPRLLILDEPTSGLDPLMQEVLARSLRELATRGHTIFFSSHTLSEVEHLCDRVAIVRRGRIVADEPLERLRRRARREVVIQFRDGQVIEGLEPPAFLTIHQRTDSEWRCELTGSAQPVIEWCATQPIEDLTIGRPSLERLFQGFYQSQEASS